MRIGLCTERCAFGWQRAQGTVFLCASALAQFPTRPSARLAVLIMSEPAVHLHRVQACTDHGTMGWPCARGSSGWVRGPLAPTVLQGQSGKHVQVRPGACRAQDSESTYVRHSEFRQNGLTCAMHSTFSPPISRTLAFTALCLFCLPHREAPLDMKPAHIYEFDDPRQVEMTARCCRVWVSREVLDEDAVQVAERVLRAGMSMLHQPYMGICWSSFLIEVRTSYQSGYMELQVSACFDMYDTCTRHACIIRVRPHMRHGATLSACSSSRLATGVTTEKWLQAVHPQWLSLSHPCITCEPCMHARGGGYV